MYFSDVQIYMYSSRSENSTKNKKEKSSKRTRRTKDKVLDKSQSTMMQFCSPEVKSKAKVKSKKADFNCNELKQFSLDEDIEQMKKKWAETDEKIKNLKEIMELTRESEQNFYKRKEAERLQEQKRLEELAKRNNIEIKNCKTLSLTEIQNLFENNLDFLINIKNGTTFSQRHKLYNEGAKGLLYNDSCSVFTKEQINKIVDLLHNHFDEGNPLHLSRYYWGVLLPELTLKIFRDMYQMNEEDALYYLKFMPDSENEGSDLDSDDF